jgi:hypothetical protein
MMQAPDLGERDALSEASVVDGASFCSARHIDNYRGVPG